MTRRPAEWEAHRAVWTAWPEHSDWGDDLEAARGEVAAMCRAIARGEGAEQVRVLVKDRATASAVREATEGAVETVEGAYGDVWLRDTGPIFTWGAPGVLQAQCFEWNGWGGKYVYADDDRVAEQVAQRAGTEAVRHDWVLEGGAIDSDGQGVCLTTRQCLLNGNRGGPTQAEAEERLRQALGFLRIVWLQEGLQNDHTDGHVDTLARFVAPGRVVCMHPVQDDPNASVLEQIISDLERAGLEVQTIPSPGGVKNDDGELMPASYANFFVGNQVVVVPTYDSPHDAEAVDGVGALFPGREVVGLSARAILTGGGAFHCITQEHP